MCEYKWVPAESLKVNDQTHAIEQIRKKTKSNRKKSETHECENSRTP